MSAITLAVAGCMTSPADGGRVSSHGAPVTFSGSLRTPHTRVELEAINPISGGFESFGPIGLTSDSAPFPVLFNGIPLYPWSADRVIPDRFWQPGRTGSYARVRGVDVGATRPVMSLRPDWAECAVRHLRSPIGFTRECAADHSPLAFLLTDDYSCSRYGGVAPAPPVGTVPDGCCTHDPAITSVQSGQCQGAGRAVTSLATTGNANETSIAFSPAWDDGHTSGSAHLVVAYNRSSNDFLGWSFSTDQGRSWTSRNVTDGGVRAGTRAARVPDPPNVRFNRYRGDPSIIAIGPAHPGMVALVNLAEKTPGAPPPGVPDPDIVVLLISRDGGETFARTLVVDDTLPGFVDQPRVTVDPADETIWVMWRSRQPLIYFTHVRGGRVDAAGGVTWFTPPNLVLNTPIVSGPDYQHPRFKVFTRPGANRHTIAVTGPLGAPGITVFAFNRCVSPGDAFWQYPIGAFFTVSEDDGRTWNEVHTVDDKLPPFALGCVGGTGGVRGAGLVAYAENRIDLALDRRNGNYLVARAIAVNDGTPIKPNFVGQQVEVWRRSTRPGSSFTRVATAPLTAPNAWQFNPSIAARDDGQIAVSYYEAAGSSTMVKQVVIGSRSGGDVGSWSLPVQLSVGTPTHVATDRDLGEYDEIVALPIGVLTPEAPNPPPAAGNLPPNASGYQPRWWPGAFYASWSDGDFTVMAAGYSPP